MRCASLSSRMVLVLSVCAALGVGTLIGVSARAQEKKEPAMDPAAKAMMDQYLAMSKPGPKHKLLEALVGTWDTETTAWMMPGAPPMVSKGTTTKSMVFGGRYLREELLGTDPSGNSMAGVGYVGFENGSKQYQGVFISEAMTGVMWYSGTASEDGKTFTFTGKENDPTGGPAMEYKLTTTITSPDSHTLEMEYHVGGQLIPAFKIVHTRRK